ncbi:ribosomal oxygenase 1-like [Clytia hemisphaerica]|uniref:Bifunctional lysine-specific demethylase and histidyl-hydroxylase n=1 Tax=Clytia hemisphaerica TaxID=252671 RepID=A0A7M5XE20_9CNID
MRRSAFSVFKEVASKSPAKSSAESTDDDQPKLVSMTRTSDSDLANYPATPKITEKTQKQKSKSEQRLSSIRKSIRKKTKHKDQTPQENNNTISSSKGKENKLDKALNHIGKKNNWTESLQSLNSSHLEEEFLPGIVQQKKQQKRLHSEPSATSMFNGSSEEKVQNKSRKRAHSTPSTTDDAAKKPPIPTKKSKTRSVSSVLDDLPKEDVLETPDEQKPETSADHLFAWVIAPVKTEQFFSDVWQRKPLFIKRRQSNYNKVWFSTKEFDNILKKQNVQFTKNLDIAVFRNGQRETLNPDGRAFAPMVWRFYKEGCSIRMLNPATFSSNVWHLCSKLQEYFGCLVGANVYLTPPASQGFAPHYDDIEAFVVQLEGKKRWRLYSPRDINETLARHSSQNLSPDELGEPILDRVLEAGDSLYFPRGMIHQAITQDDSHSLHLTLSVHQKCCWSDYMEKLVPLALQAAIEEDIDFRKALPIGFQNHIGMANSEKKSEERKSFMKTAEQLMKKLVSFVSIDEAGDELALDQMEEYLPPSLSEDEKQRSVSGTGAFWDNNDIKMKSKITLKSRVRLLRPGIVRLIPEDENLQIHHTVGNSRQYKELPLSATQVPLQYADIVEYFLLSYPEYVHVKDAPIDDDEIKLELAEKLYDLGLLMTE